MWHTKLGVVCSCVLISGCGGGGPNTHAILGGTKLTIEKGAAVASTPEGSPYVLVDVDRSLAMSLTEARNLAEQESFHKTGSNTATTVGRGDLVQVAIVSTSDNGFVDFTSASIAPISQTTLAAQEVGADGMIRVPPIGRVKVVGRTTGQIESLLKQRLSQILVDPSAIVSVTDRRSAKVAVVGKVGNPGKYSISETELRLLDLINAAGGPAERSENLRVRLSRKGDTRETRLDAVLQNPDLNVYMQANDVLEVETPETRIVILGSGGTTNQTVTLNYPDSSVVDVLGLGGGLANRAADRAGVFIYRETPAYLLSKYGVDTRGFTGKSVPTIFRFDLVQPESLFVAKAFAVADGDVLYLATSIRDAVQALSTFVPLPVEYVRASEVGPG